ncbi:T9SS type A sorting domain-containing protein, partial [bacterium]|nr:T9SS type A sorting domain-containing protein [bacterium]
NVNFGVWVENLESTAISFDAWLDVIYEGGPPPPTLVLRSFTNFQPGWTINRPDMFFPVPGSYAAGNYEMFGRVGDHPTVWYESSFPFVKLGTWDGGEFIPFVPKNMPDPFVTISGMEVELMAVTPDQFSLSQNYPNPFNPTTKISFELRVAGSVLLSVYDIQGREVARLVDGFREAGSHEVTFDASHLASGLYFYQIEAGSYSDVKKMVLVK